MTRKIDYAAQRAKYRNMSRDEIVKSMDDTELRICARRGGVDAIAELTRREGV